MTFLAELTEYWIKRSPTIFQQTSSSNICASLIHKNDQDLLKSMENVKPGTLNSQQLLKQNFRKLIQRQKAIHGTRKQMKKDNLQNVMSVQQLTLNSVEIPHEDDIVVMPEIRESDAISFDISKIRENIKQLLQIRQDLQTDMNECKMETDKLMDQLPQLQNDKKIKERTQLLLENPEENIAKMTKVLAASQERIKKLKDQWDEHRIPLEQQIDVARQSSNSKYVSVEIMMLRSIDWTLKIYSHCVTVCDKKIAGRYKAGEGRMRGISGKVQRKGHIARKIDR